MVNDMVNDKINDNKPNIQKSLSFKTKCKRNLTLYLLTCDVEKMSILKKKLTYLSLTFLKNEKNIYIK